MKRSEKSEALPPEALRYAFGVRKNGVGQSDAADGKSRLVFQVSDVIAAPAAAKEAQDKSAKNFSGGLANDLLNAYVVAAEKRAGSELNQAAIKRLLDDSAQ